MVLQATLSICNMIPANDAGLLIGNGFIMGGGYAHFTIDIQVGLVILMCLLKTFNL
jgi:hypothetical protein